MIRESHSSFCPFFNDGGEKKDNVRIFFEFPSIRPSSKPLLLTRVAGMPENFSGVFWQEAGYRRLNWFASQSQFLRIEVWLFFYNEIILLKVLGMSFQIVLRGSSK